MSDYELQFQADLEKAQALSLESLALEQFRQQRRINSERVPSENEIDGPVRPSRSRSGSGGCPPAIPPPPRRPLRRPRASPSEGTRSTSGSPVPCESDREKDDSDLISFTSPSSTSRAHIELKECIEHIHRLNQQTEQLALVPTFKGSVKLTRSNSSVSSYSTTSHNIIPYTGNTSAQNYVNPLIALPSNNPYAHYNTYSSNTTTTFPNLSNSSSANNIPMVNSKTIGFSVNTPSTPNYNSQYTYPVSTNIYPTLPNIMQNAGQPQYQYPFNRGENNNGTVSQMGNIQNNSARYAENRPPSSALNKSHQTDNMPNSSNVLFSSRQSEMKSPPVRNIPNASAILNVSADNFSSSTSDTNLRNMAVMQKGNVNAPKLSKSQSSEITKMNDRNSSQAWSDIAPTDYSRVNSLYGSIPKVMSDSSIKSAQVYPNISIDRNSSDLIDLAAKASTSGMGSVRVSVLEAFDPLMADPNISDYMCSSECSSSVYDAYDPLDFLYGGSESAKESPVYATVNRRGAGESIPSPLPSPQPKSFTPQPPALKRSNTMNSKLYECVTFVKKRKHDPELIGFLEMVKDVRVGYVFSDPTTNPGYVIASKTESQYPAGTSIKLLVYHQKPTNPITFTCDVESTVEHVILHVVCELEGEINVDTSVFTLRVWGMSEYLTPGSCLSEYDYVRQCVRLEKDILLCLQSTRNTSLARTERDDTRDNLLTLEELLPNQGAVPPISFHNLSILLEFLETELTRLSSSVADGGVTRPGSTAQAVKAICALLGGVETAHIVTALATLMNACSQAQPDTSIMKPEIVADSGEYCSVTLKKATLRDTIGLHCQRLREAVKGFIGMYCRSNRVDFEINDNQYSLPTENGQYTPLASVKETALFNIEGIHRPPINWNHDEFVIHAQIYHGTNKIKGSQTTQPFPINTTGFYPRIMFETWLTIDEVRIANLPKEARLVLTLTGRTLATPDSQNGAPSAEKDKAAEANQKDSFEKRDNDYDDDNKNPNLVHVQQEELGWTSIQLIDYNGLLICGSFILPIWPVCSDKRLGPAPEITDYPPVPHPVIQIEIPSYSNNGVCWLDDDESEIYATTPSRHSFEALDTHTQQQLMHLVDQGPYQPMPSECREILWEKRHYLVGIPGAVPLVLLAAVSWDASSRRQLMYLLDQWKSPTPYDALHLLLPCFPDEGVRERAVRWLKEAHDDTLTTLTPQLCLGLRYERFASSPLAKLLLSRALESPRFAHRLYWQLVHDIPGNSPQNSSEEFLGISLDGESIAPGGEPDPSIIASSRWVRRNQMLLRALLAIVGENLSERLLKQQLLVKTLTEVAGAVKNCKESTRNRTLQNGVEGLVPLIKSNNICLPLSVSQEVYDIDVKSCSYFPSNTLPLKINFLSSDNAIIPAIFKVGDDLRQDSLVLQVMNVMDQLWLKEGLDMRMVTFQAIPTQYRKGMIEMVCSAETLRAIQVEWGLTGSFKDKPIAEWLAKHNSSELEYERAVTNFTASCAGYSVATYLLGICDRHNDNIMLKTSGHLFHIDFGKFLGDAQMFGNFKRDRTPFVLTPDMAYVINGGERPSQKFHHFVELCCTAFNIVRKHHNLILHLFTLMASSGISGVSTTTIGYVRAALLPGQTPAEAAAAFARLIHSALRSRFTPINFFLHNLAQLRAGDQPASSNELLSFMPKVHTMAQEGRLTKVEVLGYEKRYDPEKYYVYALRIFRQGQATPSVLYRSYKHFTELYQKICLHFPLAKVHSLPVGLHMGRSNTKQAAERRFHDVQAFLTTLFYLADEIAHSDLVYTFFHPLLRDQQDVGPQRTKNKSESQSNVCPGSGALKISIQYSAGVLSVLILHAQSLPMAAQGVPPSPYVKVYLVPDQSKETKRKTRVLKRNCHPSFMEMLEYRLPMEVIRGRSLQATVWHHDPLQENQFLGGVQLPLDSIPLTTETTEWYPLQYIPR